MTSVSISGVRVDLGWGIIIMPYRDGKIEKETVVSVSVRCELLDQLPSGMISETGVESLEGSYGKAVYLGLTTSHMVTLENRLEVNVRKLSGSAVDLESGAPVQIGWKQQNSRLLLR